MCPNFSVCFIQYNVFGLAVAKKLSSVHRCLIDTCRTVIVWAVDVALYYFIAPQYGEAWAGTASFVQLAGFVVLIAGTFVYYKVIRLPFLSYEDAKV